MHDPTQVQSDMEGIFGPDLRREVPHGLPPRWSGFVTGTAGFVTLAFALALAGTGLVVGLRDRAAAVRDAVPPPRPAPSAATGLAVASAPRPSPPVSAETVTPNAPPGRVAARRRGRPVGAAPIVAHRARDARSAAEKLRQEYADDAAITRRLNDEALRTLPEAAQ